jgi:hypothetical protein
MNRQDRRRSPGRGQGEVGRVQNVDRSREDLHGQRRSRALPHRIHEPVGSGNAPYFEAIRQWRQSPRPTSPAAVVHAKPFGIFSSRQRAEKIPRVSTDPGFLMDGSRGIKADPQGHFKPGVGSATSCSGDTPRIRRRRCCSSSEFYPRARRQQHPLWECRGRSSAIRVRARRGQVRPA